MSPSTPHGRGDASPPPSPALGGITRDTEQGDALGPLIELAVRSANDGILITTADLEPARLRILYANPAFEQMSGYAIAELVGQSPRIFQGPRTNRRMLREVRAKVAAGLPYRGEAIQYRRDGAEYVVDWRIDPVRDAAGKLTHFVSVQRDISAEAANRERLSQLRKQLERAACESALGHACGAMSHELLQPLFAAHNYALACDQRIAAEPDCVPHQIAKWLAAMKECLEHGKQLVDHYRNFAGANESAWVIVELDHCIENVLQIAARELGQHHLEIHYRGAAGLRVQGDPLQLQQVLLNMIRNACDALDEAAASSPLLLIETFADPATNQVGIRLTDNGPGLPTIDRDRIFEPYLTTKSSGLGLGLAICRRIIESHGGRIDADSPRDGGAEFTIRLPRAATSPTSTSPDEARYDGRPHRIRG